ncbi:uncharacterized protein LOC127746685 [Arachis duranensis]|uniref:Uncharacterized protein LOC127746685 n=1 Tax=Arachis duranensis TaxID=130453 RepID=A0A9C6TU50_ARADU|nr:uncharacterized protein LOC127746685 [Arachis duranensis]
MSGNEPLASKIPNQANYPLSDNNEPITTANSNPNEGNKSTAPADNTSPPNNIAPINPGANNPIFHNNEPTTTSNTKPNQAITVKPNSKTPPTCPKTKPKAKAISKPKPNRDEDVDNALDPGAESDGTNSWHSEELKTPPPSEDEFLEEESDDVFSVFRNGIRFGDLKLKVAPE